jgi:hypothetical protein
VHIRSAEDVPATPRYGGQGAAFLLPASPFSPSRRISAIGDKSQRLIFLPASTGDLDIQVVAHTLDQLLDFKRLVQEVVGRTVILVVAPELSRISRCQWRIRPRETKKGGRHSP